MSEPRPTAADLQPWVLIDLPVRPANQRPRDERRTALPADDEMTVRDEVRL